MTTALLVLLIPWFTAAEQAAINSWLNWNPSWTLADPDLCTETDQLARQKERTPGYDPFRARGDFNADGAQDVAAVVQSGSKLALLIYNGKPGGGYGKRRAALLRLDTARARPYLFTHRSGHLVVGGFETDVFFWVVPENGSYRLEFNDTESFP